MERRQFLKAGCTICVLGSLGMLLPLSAVAMGKRKVYKTEAVDGKVQVPFTEFAETNIVVVRIKKWDYDVAVEKLEDGTYSAILLKCTHMDNNLNVSGGGYICNMHGSEYDKKGEVLKGPAEHPLTSYTITISEDSLFINIA